MGRNSRNNKDSTVGSVLLPLRTIRCLYNLQQPSKKILSTLVDLLEPVTDVKEQAQSCSQYMNSISIGYQAVMDDVRPEYLPMRFVNIGASGVEFHHLQVY